LKISGARLPGVTRSSPMNTSAIMQPHRNREPAHPAAMPL
jgi:hypothetical protein